MLRAMIHSPPAALADHTPPIPVVLARVGKCRVLLERSLYGSIRAGQWYGMFCSKIVPLVSVLLKSISESVLGSINGLWCGVVVRLMFGGRIFARRLKSERGCSDSSSCDQCLAMDQGSLGWKSLGLPCCVCISLSHQPWSIIHSSTGNTVPWDVVRAEIAARRALELS